MIDITTEQLHYSWSGTKLQLRHALFSNFHFILMSSFDPKVEQQSLSPWVPPQPINGQKLAQFSLNSAISA